MSSFVLALVFVAMLAVQGALKWRERGLINIISCLLIVAAFPLAVSCGKAIRGAIFSHNLDRWNDAVTWVATHHSPNQDHPITLPSLYSDLAYAVHYRHDQTCGLMIDFFWGGGFPVKHTVRRYAVKSNWTDLKPCRSGWSRARVMSGRWHEVSD